MRRRGPQHGSVSLYLVSASTPHESLPRALLTKRTVAQCGPPRLAGSRQNLPLSIAGNRRLSTPPLHCGFGSHGLTLQAFPSPGAGTVP